MRVPDDDDLTQQTLAARVETKERLRQPSSFWALVFKIARNILNEYALHSPNVTKLPAGAAPERGPPPELRAGRWKDWASTELVVAPEAPSARPRAQLIVRLRPAQ